MDTEKGRVTLKKILREKKGGPRDRESEKKGNSGIKST